MDIGIQIIRRHLDSLDGVGREGLAEGFLHVGNAKYAWPGAGHGDAHAAGGFRHEYTHHRVTRSRILELHVGGALRYRKENRRDDLTRLERGFEHSREKLIRRNLP